ncbi:MAG: hypothetical protein C3F06_10540 [Candidatus Methanoperedenaceae archaeon]|nr:MAG: hypothetical protein C3F06_10540 [Candidatus Methanoperedenaceae archaeon]
MWKAQFLAGIKTGKTILNFKNPIELLIIIILVLYSLVVINGYFLDYFHFHLNVINITFVMAVEIILFILFFKIKLTSYRKSIIYCLIIFAIVFIYSLYFSPAFLPISYSVDAVHHYVLMDYLYNHESLPNLNNSYYMQEMVHYPYGPSLFTVYISKIFGIELVETMQILVFAAAGLLAVLVYLIAKELLNEYNLPTGYEEILSLASPFMLFSVPTYFFGQYLNDNFYYSMIFGELLVIGTLFTLLKIENKEKAWINFYFILCFGIIFTYTLFLIINIYGLIAKYFAYKIFFLQVLLSSSFIAIPIAHIIKHMDNHDFKYKKIFSEITLFGSLLIIIFISTYTLAT